MSQSSTRFMIILLTLVTAIVHGVVLNLGGFSTLFTLNALGYLALLAALVLCIPAGQQVLVHYAFMAYTLVTIVAWVVMNGDRGALGWATKAVEVLLLVFLWINLGRVKAGAA